jgi:hypothetical protein
MYRINWNENLEPNQPAPCYIFENQTYFKRHHLYHIQIKVYMQDKWPGHMEVAKLRIVFFGFSFKKSVKYEKHVHEKIKLYKLSSIALSSQ